MKPQAQPGDLPLVGCADEDQAVAFDFVVAYFDDLDAGRQQRLADYLTRFPGHESIIAAEYLRQEDLHGERIPAEVEAGISDEEGDASESVGEQRLGPYRLLRELGRGGQGSVWLAADTRIQRRGLGLEVVQNEFEGSPAAEGIPARGVGDLERGATL